MSDKISLHQRVTDHIVKAIESGPGEFIMPWHRAASTGLPRNAVTKRHYRGINTLSLWATAIDAGYETPIWATFKQWQSLGAQVRRGEKSTLVVFYKTFDRASPDAEADGEGQSRFFVAKASFAFNAAQVDGYEAETATPSPNTEFDRLAEVDRIIAATGAQISHAGSRAFYRPATDRITVPPTTEFIGTATSTPREAYYSTLLHELAHWTGAPHRLDRVKGKRFADKPYAFEELVAELSAAMSCAQFGIALEPRADHAQYLASWLKMLKDDPRAIFTAAAAASAATDYIAGFSQPQADDMAEAA